MPGFTVVLPAFNEASTIERAVREVRRVLASSDELIVVDDGSTDRTRDLVHSIAKATGVRPITHDQNLGKGAAIRTGLREAHGDTVAFLDCDLSVDPTFLIEGLTLLKQADVVIGSRRVAGARIDVPQPWPRSVAGQLFNTLVRRRLGVPWKDTQCGFKLLSRRAVDAILPSLTTDGWVFDVELLLTARANGLRIVEMPVVWRNRRESRLHWSDARRIWTDLSRLKKRFPPYPQA